MTRPPGHPSTQTLTKAHHHARTLTKLLLALIAAAALAGCGGTSPPSDRTVANDLTDLILAKGGASRSILCTHENSNEFSCQVTDANGQQHFAQVSDDGHSISEIGIVPSSLPLE